MKKNNDKFSKYYILIIIAMITLLLIIASFIFSKIYVSFGVIFVVGGLIYISKYYPTKKELEEEKKKKEKEKKEQEKLKLIILSQENKNKEKVPEDFIAIDIITIKDDKTKDDKIIAIDVAEIKEERVEKEVKAYIKQEKVSEKILFINGISKQDYANANDEKIVISKIVSVIPALKENKNPIVVKSSNDAKVINKYIKKELTPTFIVPIISKPITTSSNTSSKVVKDHASYPKTLPIVSKPLTNKIQDNYIRSVNAKRLANNYLKMNNKEIKENKIEKLTEKNVCAHIKIALKDKEEVKFSKDKDGYINIIGKSNRIKLKIDKEKNNNYLVLPKKDNMPKELHQEECNDKENKDSNVRIIFNKLKDILLVNTHIVNKLKKKNIVNEIVEENKFDISYEEAKRRIKQEEQNKKIIKKLDDISKKIDILHANKDYNNELKLLNKGINKLKGKGINITNLIIRKNNLIKYFKEQKEKQKKLEKRLKEN